MEKTNCGIPGYWKHEGRLYKIGPQFQPPKPPESTLIDILPIRSVSSHRGIDYYTDNFENDIIKLFIYQRASFTEKKM